MIIGILIPLDFKGWNVWTRTKEVPGYVKVNAVDPYAKPIQIIRKKNEEYTSSFSMLIRIGLAYGSTALTFTYPGTSLVLVQTFHPLKSNGIKYQ